jgi:outer membrane protein OmpA-like peptidoglycan-associated protein
MKKILLTLILSCITLLGFSQQRTITLKNFNTWGVTANVGMNTTDGDPSDEKTLFNTIKLEPSWGFSLTKQLSHFTGLEFSYNKGNTNTRLDTQIFAYGGVGIINYTTTGPESFKEADWIHVVPVGFGAKHKLNDRFSLNLDFGYNFVNTDRFEGVVVRQSDEDGYWRTNLGLQYTIGSRKVLEWDRYTTYFTPSDEHSVDTVIVINKNIDTLFIKFMPDDSAMFSMRSSNKLTEDIVNFEFNKWDIKNKYFNTLDDLASKLNNGEIKSIVLDGHACEIGGEMNNLYVSKQRAVAIKNYLISKGVEESKVLVRFYGERMPISDEKEINRRVEIKTE